MDIHAFVVKSTNNFFRNNIKVSNSLNPDQAGITSWGLAALGPNCSQSLERSSEDDISTGKELKHFNAMN